VRDAVVTVIDALTGTVVFDSADVDGAVLVSDLPEGYYTVGVAALDHDTVTKTLYLDAGRTTELDTFLSLQTVKYSWSVREVDLEDRYVLDVEAEFSTNVPIPVVTVDPPAFDLYELEAVGDSMVVELTLTNHGFIAAQDVGLRFGTHPFYLIEAPVTEMGTLDAKSSVTVPVKITRVATFESVAGDEMALARTLPSEDGLSAFASTASATSTVAIPCSINAGLVYGYPCGPQTVSRSAPIGVANVDGNCVGGGAGWFGFYGLPGGGGGAGGGGEATVYSSAVTISAADFCESFCGGGGAPEVPLCVPGASGPVGWGLTGLGFTRSVVNDGWNDALGDFVADAAWERLIPGFGDIACAKDWVVYASCSGSGTGGGSERRASVAASSEPGSDHGPTAASAIATAQADCGCGGSKSSGALDVTAAATGLDVSENIALTSRFVEAATAFIGEIFGDGAWLDLDGDDPEAGALLQAVGAAMAASGVSGARIDLSELAEVLGLPLPTGLTAEKVVAFATRWNATLDAWEVAGATEAELPVPVDGEFIDARRLGDRAAALAEVVDNIEAAGDLSVGDFVVGSILDFVASLPDAGDGVCATVRIAISQDAVMTRTAFKAELEIGNQTDVPIEEIAITIEVRDASGQIVATEIFAIGDPELAGLTAIDGSGVIAAGDTGSAVFTLVPSRLAAPDSEATYFIGGSLSYRGRDGLLEIPLAQERIDVRPQAVLELDYFLQRNVVGDDPFTDAVEPCPASAPMGRFELIEQRRVSGSL
jgi:hypothetical protein